MKTLNYTLAFVLGATGGLGMPISRALAARGALLTVSGRSTQKLDALGLETFVCGGTGVVAVLRNGASMREHSFPAMLDRKSTRLNSSHNVASRMASSA